MKVRELMTRAETCTAPTDLAAVAMTMWRQDCGIVPVVDESRRVIGVLTDRDICIAVATRHRRPEELTARDVMAGRLFSAGPDDDVQVAMETMRTQRIRRLPVVDAEGRLEGILSMHDIIMRARPSGSRPTAGPSANEVLATLQGVCGHPLPARQTQRKAEPELVHA
jgi:CBS domain-containing protein